MRVTPKHMGQAAGPMSDDEVFERKVYNATLISHRAADLPFLQ